MGQSEIERVLEYAQGAIASLQRVREEEVLDGRLVSVAITNIETGLAVFERALALAPACGGGS